MGIDTFAAEHHFQIQEIRHWENCLFEWSVLTRYSLLMSTLFSDRPHTWAWKCKPVWSIRLPSKLSH